MLSIKYCSRCHQRMDDFEINLIKNNPELYGDYYVAIYDKFCYYCEGELNEMDKPPSTPPDPECLRIANQKKADINKRRILLNEEREKAKQLREKEERLIQRDGYKCPNCGKYGGQKISTTSRIIGLATLGVLSSNVGKTYKCKHCGYKW